MDYELEIPSLPPQQNSFITCGTNYDNQNMNDTNNSNNSVNLNLQQQAMLNQFVSITGSTFDQAYYLLSLSNWQYQAALNTFFDGASLSNCDNNLNINITDNNNIQNISNINCINNISANAPSNTPVTPPNLDFLEKAFSKLNPSLQENPSSSTGDFNNNKFNNTFYQQNNLSNINSNEYDMICSNSNSNSNQVLKTIPFSEAIYLESVKFNYYNN